MLIYLVLHLFFGTWHRRSYHVVQVSHCLPISWKTNCQPGKQADPGKQTLGWRLACRCVLAVASGSTPGEGTGRKEAGTGIGTRWCFLSAVLNQSYWRSEAGWPFGGAPRWHEGAMAFSSFFEQSWDSGYWGGSFLQQRPLAGVFQLVNESSTLARRPGWRPSQCPPPWPFVLGCLLLEYAQHIVLL